MPLAFVDIERINKVYEEQGVVQHVIKSMAHRSIGARIWSEELFNKVEGWKSPKARQQQSRSQMQLQSILKSQASVRRSHDFWLSAVVAPPAADRKFV